MEETPEPETVPVLISEPVPEPEPIPVPSVIHIYYGNKQTRWDVTEICTQLLKKKNVITISNNDTIRSQYFSDQLAGVTKYVYVVKDGHEYEYDNTATIYISLATSTIKIKSEPNLSDIYFQLYDLYQQLKITYGTFDDKVPEQKMILKCFTGNETVLELGGNVGQKSLIIAKLVQPNHLVSLESHAFRASKLEENKNLNQFSFFVENAALSQRTLITQDFQTIPSDVLLDGYQWVNTITWDALTTKYNLVFDTLVVNCNGAFYYVLMDTPEILTHLTLLVMTNDYDDIQQKNYVDSILAANRFYPVYVEVGGFRGGVCVQMYFEIWKKY